MGEKSEILTSGGDSLAGGGYGSPWRHRDKVGTAVGRRDAAIFGRGRGAETEGCGKVLLKDCHGEALDSSIRDQACAYCLLYRVGWISRWLSCIKFRRRIEASPMLHLVAQEVHEFLR